MARSLLISLNNRIKNGGVMQHSSISPSVRVSTMHNLIGRYIFFFVFLASTLTASSAVNATLIVDTGQPLATQGGWSLNRDQFGNYTFQALRFDLSQSTTITSINAWLYGIFNDYQDTLTAVLYDSTLSGGVGQALYSSNFSATWGEIGWYGPSGLDWTVGPGSYWLAIEVPTTNVFIGALPMGAPNPLEWRAWHAVYEDIDYPYAPMSTDDMPGGSAFGLRISGEVASVPEPGSLALLFIAGVALAIGRQRTLFRDKTPKSFL